MKSFDSKYIVPYIPDLVLESLDRSKESISERIIEGTLMFADISGFTAISEKTADSTPLSILSSTGMET